MAVNYNDRRFQEVNEEKQNALNNVNNMYNDMINNSDKYYNDQIKATEDYGNKQAEMQQANTDFAIEKIEQQKDWTKKDYTKEQLNVWATGQVDLEKWNELLQKHFSVVEFDVENIVGFGDIDKTGYLDRLFVHADYQRKGIATAICDQLEQTVQGNITAHASIWRSLFWKKR